MTRNTYKYHFKVGNIVVHGGITDNLARRENEHRNSGRYTVHKGLRLYWSNGHIVQVGLPVTREGALQWERENGYSANQ